MSYYQTAQSRHGGDFDWSLSGLPHSAGDLVGLTVSNRMRNLGRKMACCQVCQSERRQQNLEEIKRQVYW